MIITRMSRMIIKVNKRIIEVIQWGIVKLKHGNNNEILLQIIVKIMNWE